MIPRHLEETLAQRLASSGKVLILYGARQVGKTTLVRELLKKIQGRILEINADGQLHLDVLSSRSLDTLKGLVSGYDLLFIDEAQRVPDIGINLKILHDNLPGLKIIVTGSSSLDLADRIKEPLTGRTWTYRLYPISVAEWQAVSGRVLICTKIFSHWPIFVILKNCASCLKSWLSRSATSYPYMNWQ